MGRNMRRGHNGAFKAKVALEAIKGEKTLAQLSSKFGVHANQIGQWRKQLLDELPNLFSDRRKKQDKEQQDLIPELYRVNKSLLPKRIVGSTSKPNSKTF